MATLTVTLTSDSEFPDFTDGEITLREAVQYINRDEVPPQGSADRAAFNFADLGNNDKILFDESLFGAPDPVDGIRRAVIDLQHGYDELSGNDREALWIKRSVDIAAPEGFELEISAAGVNAQPDGNHRVMLIQGDIGNDERVEVALSNLAITNGHLDYGGIDDGTGSLVDSPNQGTASQGGGGVFSTETLRVSNVTFADNYVQGGNGGGLLVSPRRLDDPDEPGIFVSIEDSHFAGNEADLNVSVDANGVGDYSVQLGRAAGGMGGGLYVAISGTGADAGLSDLMEDSTAADANLLGVDLLRVQDTEFVNNTARTFGGGVGLHVGGGDGAGVGSTIAANAYFNRVNVSGNSAGGGGGGFDINANNTVPENSTPELLFPTGSIAIINSQIHDNTVTDIAGGPTIGKRGGGGIRVASAGFGVLVEGSSISGNVAVPALPADGSQASALGRSQALAGGDYSSTI